MSDFHTKDSRNSDTAKLINNFGYNGDVCPVAAHIRKPNIREKIPTTTRKMKPTNRHVDSRLHATKVTLRMGFRTCREIGATVEISVNSTLVLTQSLARSSRNPMG